jgi:hypothetical protein
LLVGEIALACALLVGSAILTRSLANLVTAARGLNVDGIVVVRVTSLDEAFPSPDLMRAGTAAIEAQVRTWPEVREAALSREIPPVASAGIMLAPAPGDTTQPAIAHDRYRVSAEYFAMYGVPILAGRLFQPGDTEDDVILGERLASVLSPDSNPVGSSLTINARPRRIIGIAGEVRLPTLDRDLDRPELYVPLGSGSRTLYLSLRCRGECPGDAVMRTRLASIHPLVAPRRVPALELEYQNQLQLPRAVAKVGGVFAVVALVVASAGLFSVLTEAVARRRREFGIRAALGAAPGQMRRLVLRDSLAIVALGVAWGAVGGWLVSRALVALQYGVAPGDPLTWAAVLATMAATAFAASWRPARQAGRVDPVTLLREE